MTDIEIANSVKKDNIIDVAKKIGLDESNIVMYGNDKAKIKNISSFKNDSKLILVTAISPTPYGEGKTTVSIGLNDAFRKIGKNSIAVLRQPSMGPVFGMKGGATGGGYSQVIPMEDINLHFTGDFHAITAANNLLCAAIDNHIYFGNELKIKKVLFKRCLDVNDRGLRNVMTSYATSFNITAASEIMALFCLATSLDDLKKRLGNIIIAYNDNDELVYARDLKIEGAMTVILKDAFLPNLVQSLENNPVIIHGGPFANIAHGCNSIVATKCGLAVSDYVITEAGFGADLGAEKFLDIKCRAMGKSPSAVVLVATIKALKYHGGVLKENIMDNNVSAVKNGLPNLVRHIENLKKYGLNIVVCLNKYNTDIDEEINCVKECCEDLGVSFSVSTAYVDGGNGAIDVCNKVIDACEKDYKFNLLYRDDMSIVEKIKCVCSEIYRADNVNFSDEALNKIKIINNNNLTNLPICVAKTQYSFSDDAKKLGAPIDFDVTVKDIDIYNGAGFVTVLLGDIMTMPGLAKKPNYLKIDLVNDKIIGLD